MSKQKYTEEQLMEMFEETFDEIYGEVKFGQLSYQASYVLKEIDPIAYKQAFLDWIDMEGFEETKDTKLFYRKRKEG